MSYTKEELDAILAGKPPPPKRYDKAALDALLISEPEPEIALGDRSKLERGGEWGRAINRGIGNTFEFGQDIMDIPIQSVKASLNPKEGEAPFMAAGRAAWEQINPWGEESEIDRQRRELVYDQIPDMLTEKKFDDPVATGIEWGVEALASPGKAALKPLLAAVGSGIGAGTGEYVGGDVGKMVGGLTGGLLTPSLVNLLDPSNLKSSPVNIIKEAATNSKKALANIKKNLEAGMKGSLADLAEDAGIYNLEQTVPQGSPEWRILFGQIAEGQEQQLKQVLDVFGEGDAVAARMGAQNLTDEALDVVQDTAAMQRSTLATDVAEEAADINVGLAKSRQGLEDAQSIVNRVPDSPQASEDLAAAYNVLDESIKTRKVAPAWKEFDDLSEPLSGTEQVKEVEDFLDKLSRTDRRLLEKGHPDTFDLIKNWDKESVKPSEIQSVISSIGDKIDTMKTTQGKVDNATRMLGDLSEKLSGNLDEMVTPETARAYSAAKDASRNYYQRVRPAIISKARNKNPEELAQTIFTGKDKGKAAAKQLKAVMEGADAEDAGMAKDVVDKMSDYIRSQAENVTPGFMKKYGAFLDEFPDVKKEMQAIVDSQSVLKKATAEATKRAAQLKRVGKKGLGDIKTEAEGLRKSVTASLTGRYANKPGQTIRELLADTDRGAENLVTLSESLDKPGFIRDVGEEVADSLATDLVGGKKGLNMKALNKWYDMREQLEGLVPAEQLKQADNAVGRAQSNVYRSMATPQREAMFKGMGKEMTANFMSATMAGMLPGTHTLMYGGRIRQFVNRFVNNPAGKEKEIAQLMSDPKRMLELADAAGKDWNRFPAMFTAAVAGEDFNAEDE